MIYRNVVRSAAFAALCAITLAACEGGMASPVSPSAVTNPGGDLNADGSSMKTTAPNGVFPLADATNVPVVAILTIQAARGVHLITTFAHRFQVSDSDSFGTLLSTGVGAIDPQGLIRFTTDSLPAAKKVFWRSRAESEDKFGPWSPVMAFTTVGAAPPGGAPSTPIVGGAPPPGPRPPDPPAGSRLPLPDARPFINQAQGRLGTLASCPTGRKYENNPWQDALVDSLRATDARWGYNGKPTRSAADNSGFPVIAAGDEIAYHYGAGPSLNSRDVYLIDTLGGHCGDNPSTTYRDFTGEEAGFWTGAGRFSQ
jgi:hypothetical protein